MVVFARYLVNKRRLQLCSLSRMCLAITRASGIIP